MLYLSTMTRENPIDFRRISNGVSKHLHTLQILKYLTMHWDHLLVPILTSKLDSLTLREWGTSLMGHESPPLKQLLDFIAHRCEVLEITTKASTSAKKVEAKSQPNFKRSSSCAAIVKPKCNFCQGEHVIYYCKNFVALPVSQRLVEIRSRKLCVNCLRFSSHASSKCISGQCKVCQAKHNTLLHIPSAADPSTSNTDKEVAPKATSPPSLLSNYALESSNNEQAMLSTAVVFICGSDSSRRVCWAFLDCGSQANFVTKKFVEALGLETRPSSLSICSVNGNLDQSRGWNQITIASQLVHRGYRMHRYWSDYWQNSDVFFRTGQIQFSAQHSFNWSAISHIVGYWSFNRGLVLESASVKSSPQTSIQLSKKRDLAGFWRVVWTAPYRLPQGSTRFTRP